MITTGRRIGKMQVLRLSIKSALINKQDSFVVTKNYPQDICDYLNEGNIKFTCEEVIYKPNQEPIYDEEGIIRFVPPIQCFSGYIFKPINK